jgi:hypothetical protein
LIIFQPADSCGKNPKYVDYCKKNWTFIKDFTPTDAQVFF